jgi:hypothetical protein
MRTTKLRNPGPAILALVALSILVAPVVKAACGPRTNNGDGLSPALKSLQQQVAQGQENDSTQAASPEAQVGQTNNATGTILGLWKFVLYAGGELNDAGFEQFSAGGTELANDAGAFNAGNNFCIGAWKQVGPRTYDLVHPFFLSRG